MSIIALDLSAQRIHPNDTLEFVTKTNETQTKLEAFASELNALAEALTIDAATAQNAANTAATVAQVAVANAAEIAQQDIDSAVELAQQAKGEVAQLAIVAQQWAEAAQRAVAVGVIADAVNGLLTTWSSEKILLELGKKADIDSPEFTGAPKSQTPSSSSDSTEIATTAFVRNAGATATLSGTVKVRRNGTVAYMTTDGSDA